GAFSRLGTPMRPTTQWVIEALNEFEQPLLRYAKWLLGDLDAARDVVQETFLRLCREDRQRLEGRVAAWLFTVARNLAFDARKQSGRLLPPAEPDFRGLPAPGPSQ